MTPELGALVARATPAVRASLGSAARVVGAESLKAWERNHVVRLRLADADAPTVILKEIRDDPSLGFTDWAALEYLSSAAPGVAPRLVGGDVGERLFLMADLGGSRSLDDVLRAGSRAAALDTLAALGRVSARLHAATLGDEARWVTLRGERPGARGLGRAAESARWLAAAEGALGAWLSALGIRPPAGLATALGETAAAYVEPGRWLAFTHGDPAPTNSHLAPDGAVRLLDFEYGAPRHALHDVTAWAVLCPLPRDALAALRDAYRGALAAAPSRAACALAESPDFDVAWATMAAWRAVAMLRWITPDALEVNRPWVEEWTRREAALSTLERLRDEAAAAPGLAPLVDAAAALAAALRTRLPEYGTWETIPRWPAL